MARAGGQGAGGRWLAAAGAVVGAAACSGDPSPPVPAAPPVADWDAWPPLGARFAGPALLSAALTPADGGGWEARLLVRSAGPDTVRVEHGSVAFGLRLYRDSALAGPPAWDDQPPPPPPGAPRVAYTLMLHLRAVPPGVVDTVARLRLAPGALAGVLAPGRYHAAMVYRDGAWGRGRVHAVRAGTVTIPAGGPRERGGRR